MANICSVELHFFFTKYWKIGTLSSANQIWGNDTVNFNHCKNNHYKFQS